MLKIFLQPSSVGPFVIRIGRRFLPVMPMPHSGFSRMVDCSVFRAAGNRPATEPCLSEATPRVCGHAMQCRRRLILHTVMD